MSDTEHRPYKQVARAQAQERTRNALLDTAVDELFNDRWQQTSLQALATKAGVTKQTLLRHFGSKDGLLMQALIRSASQVLDQRWQVTPGDVEGAVANLLDHYEAWGERSRRIGTWQGGPPMLAQLARIARQVHYDWIDYVFARSLERLGEPALSRRRATLIALCDVQAWWILSHDLGFAREQIQATLTESIQAVLAGEKTS